MRLQTHNDQVRADRSNSNRQFYICTIYGKMVKQTLRGILGWTESTECPGKQLICSVAHTAGQALQTNK